MKTTLSIATNYPATDPGNHSSTAITNKINITLVLHCAFLLHAITLRLQNSYNSTFITQQHISHNSFAYSTCLFTVLASI